MAQVRRRLRGDPLLVSFEAVGLARVGMGLTILASALAHQTAPEHPMPGWIVPLTIGLGLGGVPAGLLQWTPRLRRSWAFAQVALALDVIVVVGMLLAYAFDVHLFVFALVFPVVIEGAVVLGMPGALSAGLVMGCAYAVIELVVVREPGSSLPAVLVRDATAIGVALMAGSLTSIATREREALRKSEARFRAATDHSTDGVVLLSADGHVAFMTDTTAALLGHRTEDILGTSVMEYIHPDDRPAVIEGFARVLAEPGASEAVEIRALHADGSWVWLENRARNLLHDPDIGAIVVHTRNVTERKLLEAELAQRLEDIRQAGEERRRLLARMVRAQEDERAWVADALHDDPIQKLTAALMRLELVRSSELQERELSALDAVVTTLSDTIETLRRLMVELRSVPLERLGLAPALREHFDRLSVGKVRLVVVDGIDGEPPQTVRLIAYRIAQEAIANALKHAEAKELTVTLSSKDGGLWAQVRDDGKGFDPAVPPSVGHVGLTSMRERAQMAGGWCDIASTPGQGTSVSFWLPEAVSAPNHPG